jgi:hypothetical protein
MRAKRVFEGLFWIAVGSILLCNTLGVLRWSVWISILSLWPLLLVAAGIDLIGKGTDQVWLRVVSSALVLAGLLYGAFVMVPGTVGFGLRAPALGGPGQAFSQSAPHDPMVQTGEASVRVGATNLTVGAGTDLAAIEGLAVHGQAPRLTTSASGGSVVVGVEEPSGRTIILGATDERLTVRLDRQVAWRQLRLDVGAIQGNVDLRELDVSSVVVNLGASDLTLALGTRASNVAVDVNGGAASVVVRVPRSASVTIDSKSGVSNVDVPAGFERLSGSGIPIGGGSWRSAGSGGPTIAVTVKSGVSNIAVETY